MPAQETSVERVSSSPRAELCLETRVPIHLVLLAMPFLAILLNGYLHGARDQEHYLPEIMHVADPSFFPKDYLFDEPSGEFTLWVRGMAFLARRFSLEAVCFLGYLVSQYVLFWAVYHVSLNVFRCRGSALLALFLLVILKAVGGTSMNTFEPNFSVRNPAVALAMTTVLFLLTDRLRLAAFTCGAAFLIHPLVTLPLLCVLALQVARLLVRRDVAKAFSVLLVLAFTMLPLLWTVFSSGSVDRSSLSLFSTIEDPYLSVLHNRADYIFLSRWAPLETASFFCYASFLVGVLIAHGRAKRFQRCEVRIWEMVIACLFVVAAAFIFTEWIVSRLAVALQLHRCFYLMYYVGTIYAANLLVSWSKSRQSVARASGRQQAVRGRPARESREDTAPGPAVVFAEALALAFVIGLLLTYKANAAGVAILFVLLSAMSRRKARHHWDGLALFGAGALTLALLYAGRVHYPGEFYLGLCILMGACAGSLLWGLAVLGGFWRDACGRIAAPLLVVVAGLIGQICWLCSDLSPEVLSDLYRLPGVRQQDAWADVGYWCEANTPRAAMFIVSPYSRLFRVYSQRSIVGSDKDGAKVMFSEAYAYNWYVRMHDLSDYENISEAKCVELADKYGASHVVTDQDHPLRFPVLYENSLFRVYRIPDP
ncbi:DUF6798 domain-containing protein [Planctomycetota bacterium]